MSLTLRSTAFLAFVSLPLTAARADEGMWTFDAFPAAKTTAAYGWAPDQAWLDRVRSAAVRLTGGCSASFVSAQGLILTNHHCVASCVEDNSTAANNLLAKGFTARSPRRGAQMRRPAGGSRDRDHGRDAAGQSGDRHGQRRSGGQGPRRHRRRRSKAPAAPTPPRPAARSSRSTAAASTSSTATANIRTSGWSGRPRRRRAQFGGDPDNFNFPRYSLDASFLRAYEDGKPVATPQHLHGARAPRSTARSTFVVGNPGSTQRLFTVGPARLPARARTADHGHDLSERRGRLIAAMEQSPADAREGRRGAERRREQPQSLYRPRVRRSMTRPSPASLRSRGSIAQGEERRQSAPSATLGPMSPRRHARLSRLLSRRRASALPQGDLFGYALTLVRAAAERGKPNTDRYPGYTDSRLAAGRETGCSTSGRSIPGSTSSRMEWSLSKSARISRRRRSPDQAAARQGIARGAGRAAGCRNQARRPGGPPGTVGRAGKRRSTPRPTR